MAGDGLPAPQGPRQNRGQISDPSPERKRRVALSSCDIPPALADEVSAAESDRVGDVGVAWAIEQSQALLAAGVPSLHFYVMSSATAVNQVLGGLDL